MINTIETDLKKRGLEYLRKYLSEDVVITEKIDTYRIVFGSENGQLKFFKKDNSELSLIERVLTNIWEDAIIELSIILSETQLPEGIKFGIAYTPVPKPIRIEYNNIPKYILTDVTKRHDVSKKVIESFDFDEVTEWAKKLNLGRPPIIFSGKLSEKQIDSLIEYGLREYSDEGGIQKILEKSYSDGPIIEGVIIKSDLSTQPIQIESYEFALLNESYQKIESSRDFYDLTILRINSFMDNYNYPKIQEGASDDAYLEIVCDIFNNYCKAGNISEDLDPRYLNPPSYGYSGDLNLLLLKNLETIKILEKGNKIHESVFKIMLSSFRKYKKPFGLLGESHTEKFNTHVYLINEKSGITISNSHISEVLNESTIEESVSDNVAVKAVSDKIRTDVDTMRIISSIQKAFNPKAPKIIKGREKCVIYLTDPQPFTNSQKENIEYLHRTWKVPVIVGFVQSIKRQEGEKFILSDSLKRAQIEAFCDFSKSICPSFFSIESWDISEIFQYARPKYEPLGIVVDKEKKSELALQLYFEEEVMGGRLGVEENFNIGEMDVRDALPAFRSIEDNLFYTFKDLCPQPIWGFFDLMVSEYKEWNGSVPSQFKKIYK
jgi:hypothetical protein